VNGLAVGPFGAPVFGDVFLREPFIPPEEGKEETD